MRYRSVEPFAVAPQPGVGRAQWSVGSIDDETIRNTRWEGADRSVTESCLVAQPVLITTPATAANAKPRLIGRS
ncbi:MAG: hypothetical protein ACJ75Q_11085 [Gaiellaceae bacterium]